MSELWNEFRALSSLSHPNIVAFKQALHAKENLYIVTELAGPRNLARHIAAEGDSLNEDQARALFRQINDAIQYCHAHGFAHRDLKPENIAVSDSGVVKVLDFGLSVNFVRKPVCSDRVGTMQFAAPEILLWNCRYEPAPVDMWSMGVVLLEMLWGKNAIQTLLGWTSTQPTTQYALALQKFFSEPGRFAEEIQMSVARGDVPQIAMSLLIEILNPEPSERPSADSVATSAWLQAVA